MFKRLLSKLLGTGHHPRGYHKPYASRHSSSDRYHRGQYQGQHDRYGNGYYRKRGKSGSYSS
jgi:hypothetical protein